MKKIFFNIFVIFFLGSCGFTPIYIQEKNINYDVQIGIVEGDRLINNIIISQLNRSSNEKSANKIKININTEYKKTINSKNVTGAASSFELVSKTLINITKNDKTHDMIVTKKFIMDKNDNSVDQNNYERTVKENFASSIVEQLRFKLTSLE
tara:strand:+ start:1257 stop:1712 length:456 start_codon:yes stop_codon:yes gene_type:complete